MIVLKRDRNKIPFSFPSAVNYEYWMVRERLLLQPTGKLGNVTRYRISSYYIHMWL